MNNTTVNGQPGRLPNVNTLIKPEQISKISVFPENSRQKYFQGVSGLWAIIQSKPQESPEYMDAHQKLANVSASIKSMMQRQQQEASQQNGGRPPSSGQLGQQIAQQSQQRQQPSQQTQVSQPTAPGNPPQTKPNFSQKVIDKVKNYPFVIPPSQQAQGPQVASKWLSETRMKYATALQKYESAHEKVAGIDKMLRERQSLGRSLMPNEEQQYLEQKKKYEATREEVRNFLDKFQEQQNHIKVSLGQSQAGNGISSGNEPMKRELSQTGGLPATTQQEPQSQAHTVSSALGAARSQANPGGSSAMSPPQSGQSTRTLVNQSPNSHPSAENQPPQNIKSETRAQEQSFNMPRPNTPSQNQAEGQAFPLSHEAARQVARSYSNPQLNTPYPQNAPQPASHSHPPHSNNTNTTHNREQQPLTNTHSKMPIPKDINFGPPQPVSMGQSRPTMTNGPHVAGPIGQPAIQKHPGYVLEGEGERVLSKKKLEELVRQVTGARGIEGDEGETLTAEVEEVSFLCLRIPQRWPRLITFSQTLLQVADDFVDQVVVSACKLAKLRNSSTLELRDLQLILERNYNIRVPGFASDEIRAVRKVAPATGWTQKLSAVQAAKVTGSKGE